MFGTLVGGAILMAFIALPIFAITRHEFVRVAHWGRPGRTLLPLGFTHTLRGWRLRREGVGVRFWRPLRGTAGDAFSGCFVVDLGGPPRPWGCRSRVVQHEARLPLIPTGDPAFDARYVVEVPPGAWAPVLDAQTRALLVDLPADWVQIDARLEVRVRRPLSQPAVANLVDRLVRLSHLLARPATRADLVATVRADPAAAVRARGLAQLPALGAVDAENSNDSEMLSTIEAALEDTAPAVRLAAARALRTAAGTPGGPLPAPAATTLRALAADRRLPAELRREAVLDLAQDPASQALLVQLTREPALGASPWHALALLAIPLHPEALPALPAGDPQVRAAAAAALALAGPAAEPRLLALLADDDPLIIAAAAEALGRVGTARCVAPLRARLPGVLGADPRQTRAVRGALHLLGGRTRAHSGHLSLPDPPAGP